MKFWNIPIRLWPWIVVALVALVVLAVAAPEQLPVIFYKATLVVLAVVLSYWADRSIYRDVGGLTEWNGEGSKPEEVALSGWRWLCRALIFLAVLLAFTLGL